MRILMRAQIQHDKAFSPDKVLLENLMGGNIGNWLYQYSLFRALMIDENTQIDMFNPTKQKVTAEFIASVNENYDLFVLPLANAFKRSFINEMKALTKLVKGLKIPCVVPGVGIQSKPGVNFSENFEYIDESKEFVKEILNKSTIIGVRGEATGAFFKSLGFKEERDYTIIGCPSLYTCGVHLPKVKKLDYSEESKLLFSSKVEHENKKVKAVLKNLASQHSNYVYVPQQISDMLVCYYGKDYRLQMSEQPKKRFYDNDKALCFTSPYRWVDYLSNNVDLSIGTRFHGNVAAVLAGVPSLIMATDQRVSELTSYHNINCVPVETVDSKIKLRELIENRDFSSVHIGHEERFNHFVDFLEKNGLKNVYSGNRSVEHVYFDDVIAGLDFSDDIYSFSAVSTDKKLERTLQIASFYSEKYLLMKDDYKKDMQELKKENEAKIAELTDNQRKGFRFFFK